VTVGHAGAWSDSASEHAGLSRFLNLPIVEVDLLTRSAWLAAGLLRGKAGTADPKHLLRLDPGLTYWIPKSRRARRADRPRRDPASALPPETVVVLLAVLADHAEPALLHDLPDSVRPIAAKPGWHDPDVPEAVPRTDSLTGALRLVLGS
jgi:hypothetical protein